MHIVTIVGARPQFIKAATVSRAISAQSGTAETIIHTGQHFDTGMSDIFLKSLEFPLRTITLGFQEVGTGS